jgi:hypothetical protein
VQGWRLAVAGERGGDARKGDEKKEGRARGTNVDRLDCFLSQDGGGIGRCSGEG